jgi:hypothetical protein
MSKAVAALSQVAYIAEATENTTPATPGFTVLRVSGESLAVNRKFSYGSELNGKRGEKNYAVDASSGGGGFDFDGLTYGTFDAFIAAALFSAWSANVVQDATTLTSMTFETKFESGGTDVYKRLTGAYFSQLDLSFKPGARISGKASVMSMSGDFSNAAIAGATYTAGNTNPVLVGADMGALSLTGLTFDQIAGIDLSIKNTLTERYALGTLTPVGIGMGQVQVTGKIDLYVDSTMYNVLTAAQSGTSTGLSFQVGRTAGSKYQIDLPTLVIEAPTADAKSAAGDIMASINFRALQDVSTLSGSVIKVTRAI